MPPVIFQIFQMVTGIKWHSGHYFPEYFELVEAIHMSELKLPPLEINSPYKKAKMLNI